MLASALLVAGCAHAPKQTYPMSVPPSAPPPSAGQWTEPAAAPAVKPDAPLIYVVKKGDTLWDIANHFLLNPWEWPEIWVANDKVRNPHLIYPGDTLKLMWVNGRPIVTQTGENKLSPHIRDESLESAIPTIPIDVIRDFLISPRLVTPEELKKAPYVLDFVDTHIVGGANNEVFVKDLPPQPLVVYDTVRLGERYVDPDSGKELGWEAIPIGTAEIREPPKGKLAGVAMMTQTNREVHVGDRLLKPQAESWEANFYPHAPDRDLRGRIISVYDGVSQIGQYAVITISRGAVDGMEPGHVLSIMQAGRQALDPYTGKLESLPETYAGMAMVFKVEARVSYALVMKATREIHKLDFVTRPTPEQH